jgi:hypothetical protein
VGISFLGKAMDSGIYAGTARGEVLRALCNIASDDTGELRAGYDYIAFQAGVARETALRETKELIRIGILELLARGGGARSANRYRMHPRVLRACAERVHDAKDAAGHDPQARISGMKAARDACVALLEKGDLPSLLHKGNSDLDTINSGVRDGNSDLGAGNSDLGAENPASRSPKPYLEPFIEPKTRAGAREAVENLSDSEAFTPAEEAEARQGESEAERYARIGAVRARIMGAMCWIGEGVVEQHQARAFGLGVAPRSADVGRAVLAMPDDPVRRRAQSLARWAAQWAGGENVRTPSVRAVIRLSGELRDSAAARARARAFLGADAPAFLLDPPPPPANAQSHAAFADSS